MTAGCSAFVELLSARVDGELGGAREGQLEEHLASCGACRARELSLLAQGTALRAQAARKLELLEASGAIDLSGFSARVMRAVQRDMRRPSRWAHIKMAIRERWQHQRLRLSASVGLAAAACALALFVAVPQRTKHGNHGMLVQAPQAQASVDDLELMSGTTGAVFEVPGQTTVIWVSDEATE